MNGRSNIAASLAVLLMASGCGAGGADNASANTAADAANGIASAGTPKNAASPVENGMAAATGSGLSAYVGKYPSDKVVGISFLDTPAVRQAVAANVPDAKIRDFVFGSDGPQAPIVSKAGRILAWGCERHNCGYHNWSVSITPDGSTADICFYHDDDSADGPARWFLAGGRTEMRGGNCPSD